MAFQLVSSWSTLDDMASGVASGVERAGVAVGLLAAFELES